MNKYFVIVSLALGLASCASGPKTTVLALPPAPVKSAIVVVEQANNLHFGQVKFGNPTADKIEYDAKFSVAANRDMARVLHDNGIDAKVLVMPEGRAIPVGFIQTMTAADRDKWKYVIWIRNANGVQKCSGNACTTYFHLEVWLLDTKTMKAIWKETVTENSPGYNEFSWQSGDVYRDLLNALAKDKMIELPGGAAVINVGR